MNAITFYELSTPPNKVFQSMFAADNLIQEFSEKVSNAEDELQVVVILKKCQGRG